MLCAGKRLNGGDRPRQAILTECLEVADQDRFRSMTYLRTEKRWVASVIRSDRRTSFSDDVVVLTSRRDVAWLEGGILYGGRL